MNSLSDPQEAFVEHTDDFVLLLGGRQSGKTEAALRRAHRKAEGGEDVVYIAPRQGALNTHRERFLNLSRRSSAQVIRNVSSGSIKYHSGGTVSFYNGSKAANVRGLHPATDKEFIVDEVSHVDDDIVQMLAAATGYNGSVHCTTTPPTPEMPVVTRLQRASYETVTAPTMSNPAVDPIAVYNMKESGDGFENNFLLDGHKFNEHVVVTTDHGDERHIVCSLCDFEVRIPHEEADIDIAEATMYAYGTALDCACGGA